MGMQIYFIISPLWLFPPLPLLFPPSPFYHVQQRLLRPTTAAAILSSCGCGFSYMKPISAMSLMTVYSQVGHPVKVGTTLNTLNRPTRAAMVLSLAINHSQGLKRSTCRFQSAFSGAGSLTTALLPCSQQAPQQRSNNTGIMACLGGMFLCCCAEGA